MSLQDLFDQLDLARPVGPINKLEEFLNRFGQNTSTLDSTLSDIEEKDPSQLFPVPKRYASIDLLSNFFLERSEAEFALLCHAALPASLTPDLLQTLRASLGYGGLNPQWEDAIRLLLSEYFRPVAAQTYEMDLNTRRAFLKCLALCFGDQRPKDIARLLLSYYQEVLAHPGAPGYSLAKVQQITAYAYLDPAAAVRELSLSYVSLQGQENSPERMRLAALVASLSDQLSGYQELIQYAESWRAQIHQDTASLRSSLAPLMQGGKASPDAFALPVPKDMYYALKDEFTAEDPLWEAKKRIQEATDLGRTELDLSGLGLSELPEELLELRQVVELDLSNNNFVVWPELLSRMDWLEVLRLNKNGLRVITEDFVRLQRLKLLEVKDNLLRRLPFGMQEMNELEILLLENNQFCSLPYWILDSSYFLYTQGNKLPEIEIAPEGLQGGQTDFQQEAQNNEQQEPDFGQQVPNFEQRSPDFEQQAPDFGQQNQNFQRESLRGLSYTGREISVENLAALKEYAKNLAQYQRGLEKSPQKMVQLLLWESPFSAMSGFFNRVSRSTGRSGNHQKPSDKLLSNYEIEYEYAFGIDLGLAADVLVHVERFGHSPDEIGIQGYCSSNSVVVFAPQDPYELEHWVMRLPKNRKLTGVACVPDPSDPYLAELREMVIKRYPDTLSELILIHPDTDLGAELLLDLLQKASEERAITGPGRDEYKQLIQVLGNDQPIHEKEFEGIDISPYRSDLSVQNSGQGLADALKDAGYLSQIKGLNSNGTYYFSPAGLRDFFSKCQEEMKHPYRMVLNDLQKAAELYFSSPEMGSFLADAFLDLGWMQNYFYGYEAGESEFISYSKLGDAIPSKGGINLSSQNTNTQLTFEFEHLPLELKEILVSGMKRDETDPEMAKIRFVSENKFYISRRVDGIGIIDQESRFLTILFNNATSDQESIPAEEFIRIFGSLVGDIPHPTLKDIWISRSKKQNPKQPDNSSELPESSDVISFLHYPTLNSIFKRGKQSYIIREKLEWHSIRYAMGIENTITHPPQQSTRKTMLLYAREDFEIATKLIEALGGEGIRILPYTPDLYGPLENPSFGSMLLQIETIVLLFTDNFVASPQAMGYWKGIYEDKEVASDEEGQKSNAESREADAEAQKSDARKKTMVLSELKLGDEHVLEWIQQYWEDIANLPLPKNPNSTDLINHPYRNRMVDHAYTVLDGLEVVTEWAAYQELFDLDQEREKDFVGLINALLEYENPVE